MTKAGYFTQQHNQKPLFEFKKKTRKAYIISSLSNPTTIINTIHQRIFVQFSCQKTDQNIKVKG